MRTDSASRRREVNASLSPPLAAFPEQTVEFIPGRIEGVECRSLSLHCDCRGWLVELFREDELTVAGLPAMAYVSETLPGVARGPHAHREQTDQFAFVGPGDFRLILWDNRPDSPSFGHREELLVGESNRQAVVIPPGVVHGYKNVSDTPGWVFNFPNRLYQGPGRKDPVDEIRYEDQPDSQFTID